MFDGGDSMFCKFEGRRNLYISLKDLDNGLIYNITLRQREYRRTEPWDDDNGRRPC